MQATSPLDVRTRVKRYKQAVQYVEQCGKFTYEKACETNRIAGVDLSASQLQQLRLALFPGREEEVRQIQRENLIRAIAVFEEVACKLGASEKKWWQFWK